MFAALSDLRAFHRRMHAITYATGYKYCITIAFRVLISNVYIEKRLLRRVLLYLDENKMNSEKREILKTVLYMWVKYWCERVSEQTLIMVQKVWISKIVPEIVIGIAETVNVHYKEYIINGCVGTWLGNGIKKFENCHLQECSWTWFFRKNEELAWHCSKWLSYTLPDETASKKFNFIHRSHSYLT